MITLLQFLTDDSIASDIIFRVEENTGEAFTYKETTTWFDGSPIDDGKVTNSAPIYVKKNDKYYVLDKFTCGEPISVKLFGAKGDGSTDDSGAIQRAMDVIETLKGGHILISTEGEFFAIEDTISVGSNTTITFQKPLKLTSQYTTIGTLLFNKPDATEIVINNLLLDGNDKTAGGTGENGISFGNGGTILVNGGVIKGCRKGTESNKLGGKAIQVEAINVKMATFNDIVIESCDWALSSSYDINALEGSTIEVNFNNITAIDCLNAGVITQANGVEVIDKHVVNINNLRLIRCGNATDGLFVFSKTNNVNMNGVVVKGDNFVNSFIRGRISNSNFKNITINQNMSYIIDNRPSFHGQDTGISRNNIYEIKQMGQLDYVLYSSHDGSYSYRELRDSYVNITIDKDPLSNIILPQAAYPFTFFTIQTVGKLFTSDSTYMVLNGWNRLSDLPQGISTEAANLGWLKFGTSTPEGNVEAGRGTLFIDKHSTLLKLVYVKTTETGNTGWVLLNPVYLVDPPLPSSYILGGMAYNLSTKKPIWWDGAAWRYADGSLA